MPLLVGDIYGPQAQRSAPAASAPVNVMASGSVSQSASGSVSAGMPAAWMLAVVAGALLMLHFGGAE